MSDNEEFYPERENRKMTAKQKKEFLASAKRNLALGILPALINANSDMTPAALVKRAYAVAEQMVKQGDKL